VADSKPRSTGAVYRDEAADLMAAAARGSARPQPPELELIARREAPVVRAESSRPGRPLPYPDPVGINDNDDDAPDEIRQAPRAPRRRLSFVQLLARIVIAPLYLGVAAAAIGIIALVVRGFVAG
jgi:hypothetical protein